MTQEECRKAAKEQAKLIDAYAEGADLQYQFSGSDKWIDFDPCDENEFDFSQFKYRLKPEEKKSAYMPFETNAECINAIRQHGGWVKRTGIYCGEFTIDGFRPDHTEPFIVSYTGSFTKEDLFDQFTFIDGTRIGMEVKYETT
jgi:hypothetical protein